MAGETVILKQIMLALGCQPDLRIWRHNTGRLWSGTQFIEPAKNQIIKDSHGRAHKIDLSDIIIRNPRPVSFGCPGSGDIVGILAPKGKFISIEVKTGEGRQSPQQQIFEKMVKQFGGYYILARSADDAIKQLERIRQLENE